MSKNSHSHCGKGTYLCEDGKLCLHMDLVCNEKFNCPDGDDETDEACELRHEHSRGLQGIFIGTAAVFFILVLIFIILSARRVIRKQKRFQQRQNSSMLPVTVNPRPVRVLQQTTMRRILEPTATNSSRYLIPGANNQRRHSVQSLQCPNATYGRSATGRRGSWYLNNSISNLSICSEPKKRDTTANAEHHVPEATVGRGPQRMRAASMCAQSPIKMC